jgi:triacylglycerol lipase
MELRFSRLGREASAILQQGWLIARGFQRPLPFVRGDRVALFVHGYMASGPVFDPMRLAVTAGTGLATLDFSYGLFEDFETTATRLAETIEKQVPEGVSISLVGHSLGGLLSRWYVQELGGRARVDRLVTLATPHAGTRFARYAPGPLRDVLLPGSHVLTRLGPTVSNGALLPHTVIVAVEDRMIIPIESASAVEDAVVARVSAVGHNESLFSPEVHALVVDALR